MVDLPSAAEHGSFIPPQNPARLLAYFAASLGQSAAGFRRGSGWRVSQKARGHRGPRTWRAV